MRAWIVKRPGPIDEQPLQLIERPIPDPAPDEVRVRVSACGVCRTDLHLAEGDLAPRHPGVVPGHEVVGRVDALGADVQRFAVGDRVGVPWLRSTCGACRFCATNAENLCVQPRFTAWDADGGFAEWCTVPAAYAYHLPDAFDDEHAAPLLCAGIIGFCALRLADLDHTATAARRLGIYGFGASAHLAAQVALHQGATVHVMTRDADARTRALTLGCASAQGGDDAPPEPLDAAVLFAPVGALVPVALEALDRGGTLVIAGIHLSDVPALNYERHLFYERRVVSTTANTRADGEAFLLLAAAVPIRVTTTRYPFHQADHALADLAHDRVNGAAVLVR
ncbi:MAG: zinc-dependent alcohol dehydrogenase family protein [Actinobacteria bacterium]|nr:zinc-dependent alcohol dehydrogenase family protein [Actinomycetota bacterium]